jgi:hypothetical protein
MEAPVIQIDTSMGSFQVELYYKHAPKSAKNFEGLAKKGYYDGTIVSSAPLFRTRFFAPSAAAPRQLLRRPWAGISPDGCAGPPSAATSERPRRLAAAL